MALPNYPINPTEQYLANIATGEGELPPHPVTREEQYLEYIALHSGGGDAGSIAYDPEAEYSAGSVGAALGALDAAKADADGTYPGLTAGLAANLVSTVGVEDSVPYSFRTTGGSADVGDKKETVVVGGTLVWNQLARDGDFPAGSSVWSGQQAAVSLADHVCTVTPTSNYGRAMISADRNKPVMTAGHKYLMTGEFKKNHDIDINVFNASLGGNTLNNKVQKNKNVWERFSRVFTASTDQIGYFYLADIGARYDAVAAPKQYVRNFTVVDLTQMFGADIADYVAALGDDGAYAWFSRLFPKPYYAFDPGTLMSVRTGANVTVGFNAYDPGAGRAKVVGGNVYQITGAYTALTLDGENVTPDAEGYFTPARSGVLTVTGGDGDTTCVHLSWDGERDGEYEPYTEHFYDLDPDIELRGIPKLDADERLFYDGDTYESDGTVTRRYGVRAYQDGDATDGSAMVTDGTTTVYALSSPTTEHAAAYETPQLIDDFGTEEFTDSRAVAIPAGHSTLYLSNLRAKLEMAPDSPDGDGDYIVRQSGGRNAYVKLTFPADELPAPPETDGTYSLKCTVSNGTVTYRWST